MIRLLFFSYKLRLKGFLFKFINIGFTLISFKTLISNRFA